MVSTTWHKQRYSNVREIDLVPIYRSGMSFDIASQARYIEPRLCPNNVKYLQVESSMALREVKNTKSRATGSKVISNRALTLYQEHEDIQEIDAHLHFGDDLIFCCIGVPAVNNGNNVWLSSLYGSYCCPKYTFASSSSITGVQSIALQDGASEIFLTSTDGRIQLELEI